MAHNVRFTATFVAGSKFLRNIYYSADGAAEVLVGTAVDNMDYSFTATFSQTIRVFVNLDAATTYNESLYVDGKLVASGIVSNDGLTYTITQKVSKTAGSNFTIVGSLKNVGTLDLNCWAAVVLKGPSNIGYSASSKFAIAIGATAAIPFAGGGTYTIPQDAAAGDYQIFIAVGDNGTAFQEVDTGWTIAVAAAVKSVQAVGVTLT